MTENKKPSKVFKGEGGLKVTMWENKNNKTNESFKTYQIQRAYAKSRNEDTSVS